MRKLTTYILLSWLMLGCTISETLTYSVNRKPGVLAKYDAVNIGSVYSYIFDPAGFFMDSMVSKIDNVVDTIRVLDGVPEAQYTIISYGNGYRFSHKKLEKGVSTLEDIELRMINPDPAQFMKGADTLLYGMQKIIARRGEHYDFIATTRPLYYSVELSVSGFTELTQPLDEFSVEFRSVPTIYDYSGRSFGATGRFSPLLKDNPDGKEGKQATLILNKFADEHKVQLHAVSKGNSLGYKEIIPSTIGVDPNATSLQTIKVALVMNTSTITVFINDWNVGTIQLASIGG